MARLLLHVGMPKTGTTALQGFLAANRTGLAANGLTYCEVLRGPNHSQLAVAFAEKATRLSRALGVEGPADRARLQHRMGRRFARTVRPASTWVATSEHLGSLLQTPGEVGALADFLGRYFDEVRVLVVIRRGDYWLPSSYVEAVKGGAIRPLNAAFVKRRRHFLDHQRFVGLWEGSFGPGSVTAVPFLESDKRDPAALPARVLATMGVADGGAASWRHPVDLDNESISARATELLRSVNPLIEGSALRPTAVRRRAVATVGRVAPGPRTALTPDAAEALVREGLVETGIGGSPGAAGEGWGAWSEQGPAPERPTPQISEAEITAAAAALRLRAGRAGSWRTRTERRSQEVLRRWLLRLTRR